MPTPPPTQATAPWTAIGVAAQVEDSPSQARARDAADSRDVTGIEQRCRVEAAQDGVVISAPSPRDLDDVGVAVAPHAVQPRSRPVAHVAMERLDLDQRRPEPGLP